MEWKLDLVSYTMSDSCAFTLFTVDTPLKSGYYHGTIIYKMSIWLLKEDLELAIETIKPIRILFMTLMNYVGGTVIVLKQSR